MSKTRKKSFEKVLKLSVSEKTVVSLFGVIVFVFSLVGLVENRYGLWRIKDAEAVMGRCGF